MILYVGSALSPAGDLRSGMVYLNDDRVRGHERELAAAPDQALVLAVRWAAENARRREAVTLVHDREAPLTAKQNLALRRLAENRIVDVVAHPHDDHLARRMLRGTLPPARTATLVQAGIVGEWGPEFMPGAVRYAPPGLEPREVRPRQSVQLVGGLADLPRARFVPDLARVGVEDAAPLEDE